jgi:hypothetical protein
MGIVDKWEYMPLAMEEDPEDYRPVSKLAVIVDPAESGGIHTLSEIRLQVQRVTTRNLP